MSGIQKLCELSTVREFFKIIPDQPLKEGTKYLLEAMDEVTFLPGEDIVTYQDTADSGMYIILDGHAGVFDSNEAHINHLQTGDFIGELALINDDLRSATVRATDTVVCAHISKSLFEKIATNNPKIYGTFMNMLYVRTAKLVAEHERIASEMEIANHIQDSILVHDFYEFDHLCDVKIRAKMKPAKAVGGDFYDVFMIDEDRLCFLIADVSGKGVPGALLMAMAKTQIKNYILLDIPLDRVAYLVNERLLENNNEDMFITAFLCILNVQTHQLTYVNAGHNLPFISKQGAPFEMLKARPNLVLGMMPEFEFYSESIQMCPGDCFYLYTDGVTEAMNMQEEFFGDDHLGEVLNAHQNETNPDCFIQCIFDEIDEFVKQAIQSDDITMLILDRR